MVVTKGEHNVVSCLVQVSWKTEEREDVYPISHKGKRKKEKRKAR